MIKGFDKFKQFFAPHSESFIVIGGTAMQLHGEHGGFTPRVTQDIDILVIVEKMSSDFTSAFHAFLREGAMNAIWQRIRTEQTSQDSTDSSNRRMKLFPQE